MGVLDGKVVLVTGGGNGIGRECALLAAKQGAAVVVNDLGSSVYGGPENSSAPAQEVANEIIANGGRAIANHDSVSDYQAVEAMREQALKAFGGLHAVINPAGILRDAMFHKMTIDAWKAVIDVHLNGAFNVCRATIELFREQKDGAYALFTSTSGMIGNIGQANYAAAKLGVHGLSHIIAMENAEKNVRANVIAPFAWTRMISTIPVKDEAARQRVDRIQKNMRADQVAKFAVALVSPAANDVTGQIFAVRGNELFVFSQPRPVRGIVRDWTPETIIDHALPTLKAGFTGLEPTSGVFTWEPV
jgi:NAD(P)-dependent dehydrogenase (short-subunit alcohol dehydrogenase family)